MARPNSGEARTQEDHDDGRIRRPGMAVDLYRVFLRMRRGWWILAAAFVISTALGVVTKREIFPPSYLAVTSVKYSPRDNRGQPLVELAAAEASLGSVDFLKGVQEKLGRDDLYPAKLSEMFETQSFPLTSMLEIRATERSAAGAAALANAVAETLLETRRDRSQSDARGQLEDVEARLETSERELAEARAAYDAFREEYGISNLTSEQEETITAVAEARAEADRAAATKLAAERRVAELESQVASGGGGERVDTSSAVGGVELRRARLELARLRSRLTEEHPQIVALRERIEKLESQGAGGGSGLRQELAAAKADLAKAERALAPLEEAARLAQERAASFSEVEGEASGLLAKVNLLEGNIEEFNREKQTLQTLARSGQTDFTIIAQAAPPDAPESNKLGLLVLGGFPLLGLLFTFAGLLAIELRGFKVQTPSEVAFWGDGPVIGATSWPSNAQGLEQLVADLDDRLPNATGKILVVPSREEESELVEEFAGMLNEDWYSPGLVDLTSSAPPVDLAADGTGAFPALAAGSGGGGGAIVPFSSAAPSASPYPGSAAIVDTTGSFQTQQPSAGTTAWTGAPTGQALRRAARLADRVLVLVTAGQTTFSEVAASPTRLGRKEGVGYLLVDVAPDYQGLADRVGKIDEFWQASRS